MITIIENHGIETLICYYFVISILGTLPPLPESATYLQRWGYGIANAVCGNAKQVMNALNQPQTKP